MLKCGHKWGRRGFSTQITEKTGVCIVGSGPVGMVLSRVLTKLNVENLVLEKYPTM
jgi:NADPH-dependent 2,4-dienoyl-CoA reductase/sulfur reductase-like enzyme